MIKVGIKIMPREVILDTQGRAVEQSLKENGFSLLNSSRVGKFIELKLDVTDKAEAEALTTKMLKDGGLYNPLIENYELVF